MGYQEKETRQEAFLWSSEWDRATYEIKKQNGVDVICAIYGTEKDPYKPLEIIESYRPEKPSEKNNLSPAGALACINTNDHMQILDFVNQWGLLGLWRVDRYKLRNDYLDQLPHRPHESSSIYGKFSGWYHHPNKSRGYRWQEPVAVFAAAVEEYKEILEELEQVKSGTAKSVLLSNMRINDCLRGIRPALSWDTNKMEWVPGWKFISLLDAIYLRLFISSQSGKHWSRCKYENCRDWFLAINPSAIYCSERCAKNQSKYNSRNDTIINAICKQYPSVNSELLRNKCEELLNEKGIGEVKLKKIINEFIESIDTNASI